MTADNNKSINCFPVLKECVACIIIAAVLFTMDRCLENMYCFFLYDTGKRWLDVFMSAYLHAHRWFPPLIIGGFIIWLCMKKFRVNYGILFPIVIVYAAYLFTSLMSGNGCSRWINTTLFPLTMYLFVTVACSTQKGIKRFVFTGTILYTILLLLNAIFTVFPQAYHIFTSWEPDYFLSADNLTGFPLLFGLFLALLDHRYNCGNLRLIIYIFLFILNEALIHCASSLIAALCIAVFFVLYLKKDFQKNLNFYILLSVGLCFLLVFTAWFYFRNEKAAEFLNPILRIRTSSYVRFIIWNGAFLLWLKKPLFGYGLGEKAEFFLRPPDNALYYNAHNAYLQTLYEGGLFTQGTVFLALWTLSQKLKQCNDQKLTSYITAIIFAELIMMQASITSWFTWYPILIIAQIGALCCLQEEVENERQLFEH